MHPSYGAVGNNSRRSDSFQAFTAYQAGLQAGLQGCKHRRIFQAFTAYQAGLQAGLQGCNQN